jgi:TolB protein
MTKSYLPAAVLVTVALAFLPAGRPVAAWISEPLQQPQQQQPTDFRLSLVGAGTQPKVGLPDFTIEGSDKDLADATMTLVNVLWDDLDFEKEYYLIPRKSTASIPVVADAKSLPFDRWKEIGADYVILGTAKRLGDNLDIEFRLVGVHDDNQGKEVFSWHYGGSGCSLKNARFCAHFISDDFHKKTRGVDGVARTKLAFSSDRDGARMTGRQISGPGPGKEVYIADYDGANQMPVTANRNLNLAPAWSPDGHDLAYTSWVSGYMDVYVRSLFDAKPPTRPAGSDNNVENGLAAWSPDGSKLAFASTKSGDWDIWVVNRDGTGLHNITNYPKAIDNAPAWSPTGAQIAFTSDRTGSGSNQIYIVGADGVGLRQITFGCQGCDRPTWSSLNVIAYTAGAGPGHDIYAVDLNNNNRTIQITDGQGSNESPTFAPNGRHVAFVTTRWGKEQVATIAITGNKNTLKRVTEVGNNRYPNWSRTPGGQ